MFALALLLGAVRSETTQDPQLLSISGPNHACRVTNAVGNLYGGMKDTDFTRVRLGAEECKARCLQTANCTGVEVFGATHCELWTTEITNASQTLTTAYDCLRVCRSDCPEPPTPSPTPDTAFRRSAPLTEVDPRAVCFDGTPAVYYYRPGWGAGERIWIIHQEAGGWCTTQSGCEYRSANSPHLVSSAGYPETDDLKGLFDSTATAPITGHGGGDLALANMVFLRYCTSDAHIGDAEVPAAWGSAGQWRGARVVRAMLRHLVSTQGLGAGDLVVYGGSSAGARGAMAHLDYVQGYVAAAGAAGVSVLGYLDSGLYVDEVAGLVAQTQAAAALFGSSGADALDPALPLGADCAAAYPGEPWKCLFGEFRLPRLSTTALVAVSQQDSYQYRVEFGYGTAEPSCLDEAADPQQRGFLDSFATRTRELLEQLPASFSWCDFSHAGHGPFGEPNGTPFADRPHSEVEEGLTVLTALQRLLDGAEVKVNPMCDCVSRFANLQSAAGPDHSCGVTAERQLVVAAQDAGSCKLQCAQRDDCRAAEWSTTSRAADDFPGRCALVLGEVVAPEAAAGRECFWKPRMLSADGPNRACRKVVHGNLHGGAEGTDFVKATAGAEECKALCAQDPGCTGVEVAGTSHCELWRAEIDSTGVTTGDFECFRAGCRTDCTAAPSPAPTPSPTASPTASATPSPTTGLTPVDGCWRQTTEADCVASEDSRGWIAAKGSTACHWCCGGNCGDGAGRCEAGGYLAVEKNYTGPYKNGLGTDTCPPPPPPSPVRNFTGAEVQVLVHYMLWFGDDTSTGFDHWHGKEPNAYFNSSTDGCRNDDHLDTWYPPLRGKYATFDDEAVEEDMRLMQAAGVSGVIFDYQLENEDDHLHARLSLPVVVAAAERHGLTWAFCVDFSNPRQENWKVSDAETNALWTEVIEYASSHSSYLRDAAGKRMFYSFGSTPMPDASVPCEDCSFFAQFARGDVGLGGVPGEAGSFLWVTPQEWDAAAPLAFYEAHYQSDCGQRWPGAATPCVGIAFPAFEAVYDDYGTIPYSATRMRQLLDLCAKYTDYCQVYSWNDVSEGTHIMPSHWCGFENTSDFATKSLDAATPDPHVFLDVIRDFKGMTASPTPSPTATTTTLAPAPEGTAGGLAAPVVAVVISASVGAALVLALVVCYLQKKPAKVTTEPRWPDDVISHAAYYAAAGRSVAVPARRETRLSRKSRRGSDAVIEVWPQSRPGTQYRRMQDDLAPDAEWPEERRRTGVARGSVDALVEQHRSRSVMA